MKVGMISLGCPKNLVDSEVMMGVLGKNGFEITSDPMEAEVLVVNTCSFLESSCKESVDTILEMARLKENGSLKRLIVAGCLVERFRDGILKEIPEVDDIIGVNQIEQVLKAVKPEPGRITPVYNDTNFSPELYLYDETTPRLRTTPSYTAYIKIAEGCNHTCSFCIIPKLRGVFRSRITESIIKEAEKLASEGVKELVLISQDTSEFGADLGLKDGLASLLEKLSGLAGLEWIRFLYAYPTSVSDELLRVVSEHKNLCSYFDIPLQHVSSPILNRMRRGGNRELYERMVQQIRDQAPEAVIRTTFIVGFPGETEDDFEELLDFTRRMKFDRLGVFTYSDEEESSAYELDDKIDHELALERERILMQEQAKISLEKNMRLVASRVKVLLEGISNESDLLLQGRMESQAPEIDGVVLINDVPEGYEPVHGSFVMVELTEAHEHDLVGRIL